MESSKKWGPYIYTHNIQIYIQLQYYFQYNTGSAQGLVKPVQYSLKLLMLVSSQIMSTVHGVQICNPHSCTVKL